MIIDFLVSARFRKLPCLLFPLSLPVVNSEPMVGGQVDRLQRARNVRGRLILFSCVLKSEI